MPKKKTSKKPINFSKEKPLAKTYKVGSRISITGLKEAITEALFEADYDTFKGCIAIFLDRYGSLEVTKKTGLSKQVLHKMCKPASNPTLKDIGKVLNYINHLETKKVA